MPQPRYSICVLGVRLAGPLLEVTVGARLDPYGIPLLEVPTSISRCPTRSVRARAHGSLLHFEVFMSRLRSASPGRWFRPDPSFPVLTKPGSGRIARRADMLQRVLALWAPGVITAQSTGAGYMSTLLSLALVDWARPPELFRGDTLRALVDHLLRKVRYPLPESLYALVLPDVHARGREQATKLLACLGRGGSLEDAVDLGLLPALDRKERHELWLVPPQSSLELLVLTARVSARKGPQWLAPALHNAHVAPTAEMLRWFVERTGHIGAGEVGLVADWMRQDPKAGVLSWSPQRVLREMHAWHEARTAPGGWRPGPLPRSPFRGRSWREGEHEWEISELSSGSALREEGATLQHCVATYYSAAVTGRVSLWSLRCDGQRALTIEVLNAERSIVQARGQRNRFATESERSALSSWAEEQGLVVRRGVLG